MLVIIKKMANPTEVYTISVDKDIIHLTLHGSMSAAAVDASYNEVQSLLHSPKGPKDLLINLEDAEIPGLSALKRAMGYLDTGSFRRLAIYGSGQPGVLNLTSKMLHATDKGDKLKAFREEKHARDWLQESGHPLKAKVRKHLHRSKET